MPFPITCPACQTVSPCPDQFAGRKVKCKKCGEAFLATKPGATDDVVEEVEFVDEAPPPMPPLPKRSAPPRETRHEAPAKRPPTRYRDDDDDDDDDDFEERPRRRRPVPARSSNTGLFVILGVATLVLLAGGGGLAYLVATSGSKPSTMALPPGALPGTNNPRPQGNDPNTRGWIEKHDVAAGYRVKFPVEPRLQPLQNQNPFVANATLYLAVIEPEAYMAMGLRVPNDGRDANTILDAAMNGGIGNVVGQGQAQERRRINTTYKGHPARQIELTKNEGGLQVEMVAWFIYANGRLVYLFMGGLGITPDHPKAQGFLNSLQFD